MASPHPAPTRIKKLRGTDRADRRAENEIQPETVEAIPEPPETLGEAGREMWWVFCKTAFDLGLLTKIGIPQIEAYCEYYDVYDDARGRVFDKKGNRKSVIKLHNGALAKNPYLKVMDEARKEMRYIEDRWGLNPSYQSKISVQEKKAKSLDDEFDL